MIEILNSINQTQDFDQELAEFFVFYLLLGVHFKIWLT
jgi:hypothetical protein